MRQVLRADLPRVADVWVDAFSNDPFFRWIVPDDAAWPAFGADWMRFMVDLAFERGHTFLAEDDSVAVAWIPPDLELAGPADVERGHALLVQHAGPQMADDALAAILALRPYEIEEPHWTLHYIGVRSSARGGGRGAAAVAPYLATFDREGLRCGLNSTNPRNVTFYERHGFAVVAEVPTPDGATAMRPMHRAAGSG